MLASWVLLIVLGVLSFVCTAVQYEHANSTSLDYNSGCEFAENADTPECQVKGGQLSCAGHGLLVQGKCVCVTGYEGPSCATRTNTTSGTPQVDWQVGFMLGALHGSQRKADVEQFKFMKQYGLVDGELSCPNNCSNHGWCDEGICVCEHPYLQPECAPPSPNVSHGAVDLNFESGFAQGALHSQADLGGHEVSNSDRACVAKIEVALRHTIADMRSGVPQQNATFQELSYTEIAPMVTAYQTGNPSGHFLSVRDAYDRSRAHGMNTTKLLHFIDTLCDQEELRKFEEAVNAFGVAQASGDLATGNRDAILQACEKFGAKVDLQDIPADPTPEPVPAQVLVQQAPAKQKFNTLIGVDSKKIPSEDVEDEFMSLVQQQVVELNLYYECFEDGVALQSVGCQGFVLLEDGNIAVEVPAVCQTIAFTPTFDCVRVDVGDSTNGTHFGSVLRDETTSSIGLSQDETQVIVTTVTTSSTTSSTLHITFVQNVDPVTAQNIASSQSSGTTASGPNSTTPITQNLSELVTPELAATSQVDPSFNVAAGGSAIPATSTPIQCSSKIYEALWTIEPRGTFLSWTDAFDRMEAVGLERSLSMDVVAADSCPGGCSNVGYCRFGECVCPEPYSGVNCERLPDQDCPSAISAPCNGNGVCDRTTGKCMCDQGYSGLACDEEDLVCFPACSSAEVCVDTNRGPICEIACPNSCSGHGLCSNRECSCYNGWSGVDCGQGSLRNTTAHCKWNCTGHGMCLENSTCLCESGYEGTACELRIQQEGILDFTCDRPCNHHGHCFNNTCKCGDMWYGENCEFKYCPYACTGHGTCSLTGVCSCYPGWYAVDCSLPLHCPLNCSQHGLCDRGVCRCDQDWTGSGCEIPVCSNNCSHPFGECLSPSNCSCQPHFIKDDCSFRECDQGCVNGVCINIDPPLPLTGSEARIQGKLEPVPICECSPNWIGANCTIPDFDCPKSCSGHGVCDRLTGTCNCSTSWRGPACDIPHFSCLRDCSYHGSCNYTNGVCTCDKYYSEADCSVYTPPALPPDVAVYGEHQCAEHGIWDSEVAKCVCISGYSGEHCERITPSCPNSCSGHGRCDLTTARCACVNGWELDDCSQPPPTTRTPTPTPTPTTSTVTNAVTPTPTPTLADDEDDPLVQPPEDDVTTEAPQDVDKVDASQVMCCKNCSGLGICNKGICECEPGFGGACCEIVYPPCHNNCSGAGLCELIKWESKSTCVCEQNHTEPGCGNTDSGCPYQCSGHGYCRNGRCECHHNMVGEACNIPRRCPDDCQGGDGVSKGTCVNGECVCEAPYSGPDCRVKDGDLQAICPNDCCGRGECKFSTKHNKYYCSCQAGTGGEDCCMSYCPNDCSQHGSCRSGKCVCDEGWEGIDCSQAITYCPGNKKHEKYPGPGDCWEQGLCSRGVCICPTSNFKCDMGTCKVLAQGSSGVACENLDCPRNCLDVRGYRTPRLGGLDYEPPHGRCNATTGNCSCTNLWQGDDCSVALNVWESLDTTERPIGRSRFSAVHRKDGTIVIYGGFVWRRCPIQRQYPCDYQLGDMWKYDIMANTWSAIRYTQVYDNLPRERAGHAAVLVGVDEYMFMFGGTSNDIREDLHQVHKDTWLFNFETNYWHRFPIVEPGDLGRFNHAMVSRRYSVLVLFGEGMDGYKKDAWEFELKETETWTKIQMTGDQIPEPRVRPAVQLLGDQLFVYGGLGNSGKALADTFVGKWDCELGKSITWKQIITKDTPYARWGMSAMTRRSTIFVWGGEIDAGYKWRYDNELWSFDMAASEWKKIHYWYWNGIGTPKGREGHYAWFVPKPVNSTAPQEFDVMFIFGGHHYTGRPVAAQQDYVTKDNYLNDIWVYKLPKPATDEKLPCSDCSKGRLPVCTAEIDATTTDSLKDGDGQILLDPHDREVDDEYSRSLV